MEIIVSLFLYYYQREKILRRGTHTPSSNYHILRYVIVIIHPKCHINMASDFSAVRPDSPIVDAHVHILPNEILQAVQDWFAREIS